MQASICNFLSSSAGFNLCSCFFRLTFDFRFRFRPSLGLTFHDHLSLSVNFLTPAVFAFFRPLQFWVPTTQPLFLPFPLLPGFASHCSFRCSGPLSVPCLFPSFWLISHPFFRLSVLGTLFVSFCPSLFRSHSCSTGADIHFRFYLFPFTLLSYRSL